MPYVSILDQVQAALVADTPFTTLISAAHIYQDGAVFAGSSLPKNTPDGSVANIVVITAPADSGLPGFIDGYNSRYYFNLYFYGDVGAGFTTLKNAATLARTVLHLKPIADSDEARTFCFRAVRISGGAQGREIGFVANRLVEHYATTIERK